jgi:hypothetical protein
LVPDKIEPNDLIRPRPGQTETARRFFPMFGKAEKIREIGAVRGRFRSFLQRQEALFAIGGLLFGRPNNQ